MTIELALPVGSILKSKKRTYKVVGTLGAGGFGITYKVQSTIMVENLDITTYFAIKEHFIRGCDRKSDGCTVTYSKSLKEDVELSRKDFIVEAERLNKLSGLSRNIVPVNEVFQYNNTAYYVMRYLDGGELSAHISREGALSESHALSIIKPICEAVAMLHKERLLHLDIKPDNIVLMTDADTGEQYPVLIDFGIAKHFSSSGKPTSMHSAKGASDGYAPMEQYSKIDYFAPEMDVYALAATLLHMLSGQIPKNAFDITEEYIQQVIPEDVSVQTRNAIIHAMQARKNVRTPNVLSFLKELANEQTPATLITPASTETKKSPDSQSKQTETLRSKKDSGFLKTALISIAVAALVMGLFIGGKYLFRSCGQTKETKPTVETPTVNEDSLNAAKADSIAKAQADSIAKAKEDSIAKAKAKAEEIEKKRREAQKATPVTPVKKREQKVTPKPKPRPTNRHYNPSDVL